MYVKNIKIYLKNGMQYQVFTLIFGVSKTDEHITQEEKETNCKVDFQVTDFNVKMWFERLLDLTSVHFYTCWTCKGHSA